MIIIFRTLILYTIVVVVLRLMGKRQIAQLQPFELVILLMISELASIPSQDRGIPLVSGIIPILVLLVVGECLSYITLKSEKARGIICGRPTIVISKGKIEEDELRKMRYNLSDLFEQLRTQNVFSIKDVEYAIMETNGELSVILKSNKRPVTPEDLNLNPQYEDIGYPLICDGKIQYHNLNKAKLDLAWLNAQLKKENIKNPKDVFLAYYDGKKELFVQKKREKR